MEPKQPFASSVVRLKPAKVRVVCIDDQEESLQLLIHDLRELKDEIDLYDFTNTEDAFLMMEHIYEECEALQRNLLKKHSLVSVAEETIAMRSPFGVILSNHIIPGGRSGLDFLKELYWDIRYQETKRILVTGSPKSSPFKSLVEDAKVDYLVPKPWKREALVGAVRRAMNDYRNSKTAITQPSDADNKTSQFVRS